MNVEEEEEEITMLQIQDTLVSLDLAERYFCCDLEACKGACCIEGDAGAPLTPEEAEQLEALVDTVSPYLPEESRRRIAEAGVSYVDEEGDLVTQLVGGRNCVFATRGDDGEGICYCAVDRAHREGLCRFRKPSSCHLYPLRLTEYPTFTAVNYHRWEICRPAEALGRRLGIRLYKFLAEPLTERFGKEWYDELCLACETYLEEQGEKP